MMEYYLAWWNLENLFDLETGSGRPEWLQKKLAGELKGWNASVLKKKINQLAKVIKAMNDGAGPDLLGVCEIESAAVLKKLLDAIDIPGRQYAIVHADTKDKRGIDVAFIYDKKKFSVDKNAIFNHVVLKRNATRDILQATFKTKNNNEFVVMGNHWPSRRGGEEASAPYRIMAAETMAYWHQRVIDIKGETPVFTMGDFNDEPFNVSVERYALSTRSLPKVTSKRAKNPYLYNLMWELLDQDIATHSYNKVWGMLDQIMVNRAGLDRKDIYCTPNAVDIFVMDGMIKRGQPIRFSRPSTKSGINEDGFSDHLPVTLKIKEKL